MLIETSFLVSLTVFLIYQAIRRRWSVLKEWNIPHEPPSLRNVGHATIMFGKNTVEYELQCKKKFGNIWGYYMFMRPRIVIHDPEIIRQIMIKDFSTFPNRFRTPGDFGSKVMEDGILLAHGKHWKRMRTALSPTFSNMKLKAMSGLVTNCIDNTLTRIQRQNDKKIVAMDIKDLFNRLSLDVICSTVFSVDVNSQDTTKPVPEIAKHAKLVFQNSIIERIRIFLKISFPSLRKYLGDGKRKQHVSYFGNICRMFMESRKHDSSSQRSDIMEGMLIACKPQEQIEHEKKGLTDSEVLGNAVTMLLAGYETTAAAMTYLSYNLAFHMDVQLKLQAEIDDAFPVGHEVNFDAVNNLKYLDMCINESLRLYCPIGRTIRCPTSDVTIGGLKIPKGVVVSIPIASFCRDPDFWEEPMKYNPERMRDMRNIDSIIYQPFGSGPRNCIGMKFALMEMKLTVCTILRKYSFKTSEKTPRPPLILQQFTTTSPVDDIDLILYPRK